ncbi:MAG TPA: 7-cyano-7-deazaguanine synthase [Nitrososphaerales archaeon]|nr:7-cyano-7-deazaguanine synthase [Nitrososphaerales archaeon]
MPTKEAIVLLSGGIDSATCALLAKEKYVTRAVTFVYGGIARGELRAARELGQAVGTREHRFVRLPDMREASDTGARFEGLPPTYIPMRNAVFYSLAASFAEETGADYIVGGHNKDDLKVFQDAGPAFFDSMEAALWAGSKALKRKRLRILRPLQGKTKPQVIRLAASLGVPFQVTWSCHSNGTQHCWKCEGCLNRVRSFDSAGVSDPLRVSRPEKVS